MAKDKSKDWFLGLQMQRFLVLGGLELKAGKRHTLDEDLLQVVEALDFRQSQPCLQR